MTKVFALLLVLFAMVWLALWSGERAGEKSRKDFIAKTGVTPERALWLWMRGREP